MLPGRRGVVDEEPKAVRSAYLREATAVVEGELSDADLERVAGGKQDITANCLVLGGTAVSNTVMQLNL